MLTPEHFRNIKIKEIIFTLVAAGIVSLLIFITNSFASPVSSLIFSLTLMAFVMNLLVYIIKKSGVATIFYVFIGMFTFHLLDLGFLGFKKFFTLLLAGLVFEFVFLFFKKSLPSIRLDLVLGTSISTASIPLITGFILSARLASSFPSELINLTLLGFISGLFSSILAFLFWLKIRKTKRIIELQSYLLCLAR